MLQLLGDFVPQTSDKSLSTLPPTSVDWRCHWRPMHTRRLLNLLNSPNCLHAYYAHIVCRRAIQICHNKPSCRGGIFQESTASLDAGDGSQVEQLF